MTPGSTTARWLSRSISRMSRIRDMTMRTPSACGSAPPESPVPEPRATNGMPRVDAGADRRGHLFGRLGQHDESGDDAVVHEAVAVVGPQLGGVRDDAAGGQERPQLGDHALDVHDPIMSPTRGRMQVGATPKNRG